MYLPHNIDKAGAYLFGTGLQPAMAGDRTIPLPLHPQCIGIGPGQLLNNNLLHKLQLVCQHLKTFAYLINILM